MTNLTRNLLSGCCLLLGQTVLWAQTTSPQPTQPTTSNNAVPPVNQPALPGNTTNSPAFPGTGPSTSPPTAGPVSPQGTGPSASPPANNNFNFYGQNPWFSNQGVRQQFPVNQSQFNQMSQSYQGAWQRYDTATKNLGNLPLDQRQQAANTLRNQLDKDLNQSMNGVLAKPALQQRYNQLNWQYRGFNAFGDQELQQKLNLTPQQLKLLSQYDNAWQQQLYEWGQLYPANRRQVTEEFNAGQRIVRERINATLTPDQRQAWRTLIGPTYSFSPDVYFGTQGAPNNQTTP